MYILVYLYIVMAYHNFIRQNHISPVKIAFHPGQIATEMILAAHASELYVVSPKKNVGECRWGNLVNFDAKVGKFVLF